MEKKLKNNVNNTEKVNVKESKRYKPSSRLRKYDIECQQINDGSLWFNLFVNFSLHIYIYIKRQRQREIGD